VRFRSLSDLERTRHHSSSLISSVTAAAYVPQEVGLLDREVAQIASLRDGITLARSAINTSITEWHHDGRTWSVARHNDATHLDDN
jgi:hypothetical protein